MSADRADAPAALEGGETACDFPSNTCPASRHAEMIADQLDAGRLRNTIEDPAHAAGAIRSVVESLWQARTVLNRIGLALLGPALEDRPWWSDADRVLAQAHLAKADPAPAAPAPVSICNGHMDMPATPAPGVDAMTEGRQLLQTLIGRVQLGRDHFEVEAAILARLGAAQPAEPWWSEGEVPRTLRVAKARAVLAKAGVADPAREGLGGAVREAGAATNENQDQGQPSATEAARARLRDYLPIYDGKPDEHGATVPIGLIRAILKETDHG